MSMIKIDTSPVTYFSQKDEDHFFAWLQEIPCVTSIEGGFMHIDFTNISEMDLRDILAVLYRYKVPMPQLRELKNHSNEHWFADPQTYWYESVFGK